MKLLVALVIFLITGSVAAQTGTVRGSALDASDNTELIGAFVGNKDKTRYARVDLDGKFTIKMPAGKHFLYCELVGYFTDSIEVTIVEGQVTVIDFRLIPSTSSLGPIEIVTDADDGSTSLDDITMQRAKSIVTSMGQDLAKNTGATDVATFASKGSGMSIEGGKYVYVRGLSDRYSKTTINGAEVPGLDPNRNSVQMDLFPTFLVKNLLIYKAFTPDLPASFTGGLVDIQTVD